MPSPLFANLSSLIGLSREHGVDMNPTLLRVLTDLYIQKPTHPPDDERQFIDMILALIDKVDADTRGIVTGKLMAYPGVPEVLARRLDPSSPQATSDNTDLGEQFFQGSPEERKRLLLLIAQSDDAAGPAPGDASAEIRALEAAALSGRPGDFVREIERGLRLARPVAQRIVNDPEGSPLLVVAKALDMPTEVLQRVLLFVNPAIGHSVRRVFDLSALYGHVSRTTALKLVALWRGDSPQPRPNVPAATSDQMRAREAATPAAHAAPAMKPMRRQRTI